MTYEQSFTSAEDQTMTLNHYMRFQQLLLVCIFASIAAAGWGL